MHFFSEKKFLALGLGVLLLAGSFWAGLSVGKSGGMQNAPTLPLGDNGSSLPPTGLDASPLWEAWSILDEKFVPTGTSTKEITEQEKLWGAIEGLARAYGDPYTVFLPPDDAELFESTISGNFEGVGMEIGIRDGVLVVVSPLKGTPAERAGIKSGDKILRIDGTPTEGLSVDAAVKRIRGPKDSVVNLTLAREGRKELLEVRVERDTIEIPVIETELRGDGVFVISLYSFSATSPSLFRDALREFILSGSDKLVLDLRGNPGGYLEAAVDMASWFLPSQEVVVREDSGGKKPERVFRSRGYDIFNDNLKMAILINEGSASASEILAGALREHGIAVLVGEKSFGKGSVQELIDVTDHAAIKVTVARWLTPNGHSISENGLEPDLTVEEKEDGEVDEQLEKAVELLRR